MKKIVKYLVAAVAMVAAVSCQEELALNERPAQNSGMPVFTASLNNLNTRTVLEEESMKTLWSPEDSLNVMDFEGVNNVYGADNIQEPVQKADLTFRSGGSFYGNSVFAVYPYSEINEFWSDQDVFGLVVNYPAAQHATAGTFDSYAAVHVAYNADFEANSNLVFNNLSALIKFTVTDPGVKKLTFYGLTGEIVSGPIKYRYDNGNYVAEDLTAGYDYVDLYAPSGQYLEMGKNYYIAVAPGTFENGVAIEVNNHLENKIVYKHEGKVVLNPNTINNFGSFETMGDLTWGLVGDTINDWGNKGEDVVLEKKGDMFVYEGYEFTAETQFKIRATNQWNDDANYGLTFRNFVEENGVYDLTNGGWSQNIYVRPGTYDIWFDPFGMKLYMMEPGVDPAEAETIVPTRYVTGTLNGWAETPASEYKMTWDEEWFTAFVEFPEGATPEFKTNVGSWKVNWGVQLDEGETYEYESGELFDTANDGPNVKLPEPGFYMIQQSWDGYSMVVTDVVAPARGSQIYIPDAGLILDLGSYKADSLSVVLATDYPIYNDAVIETYKYEIIPESLRTGKIAYVSDAFATDGYTYIYYSFDNDGVMSVAGELGFEGYAEVEVWTEDNVLVFEERPEVILEGMWVGYTSTDDMVLLDMTEEKKLTYSYLAKDADGKGCWIKMIDSEAYTIAEYPFGKGLVVDEVERVFLSPVSKEAMVLSGIAAVKGLDEEVEIWPITSLKEEDLPETFYNAPDFKQWTFAWDQMYGLTSCIDLGVTTPGQMQIAYSIKEYDELAGGGYFPEEMLPYYMYYVGNLYEIIPESSTSGQINMIQYNMYDEIERAMGTYTDFDGKSFVYTCEMLGIVEAEASVSETFIPIYNEYLIGDM